jgi:hypothetical protein
MTIPKGIGFIDPELQCKAETDGFAVLPLLTSEQADILMEEYACFEEAHDALDLPFATTSHSNSAELISAVDTAILRNVAPYIGLHIDDYELLFSNFLVKAARPDSQTPPHQDVTLVDERLFTSYSIWVALHDVDGHNGCLKVLPGSHRHHPGIRPNPSYPWRFRDVVNRIEADMISVPLRKGEALIFSHALIHGSGANHSDRPRVAAVIALYPSGAELFHYQVDSHDAEEVHKYAMDRDAFVRYVKGAHPSDGRQLATLPFDSTPVSAEQYEKMRGRKAASIFARMKDSIFGQ